MQPTLKQEPKARWANRGPMSKPVITPASAGTPNPWAFAPLMYFMQAIPVTLVQEVSAIIYKTLGVDNAQITQWTSLIALPWTMQLLLGPFVDLLGTKRNWILGGQAAIVVGISATALALKLPNFFGITLGLLFVTAIFSALCNIATDGFYILALSKEEQAKYVGLNSTFYRLGRLFCSGLLVYAAGQLMGGGITDPRQGAGPSTSFSLNTFVSARHFMLEDILRMPIVPWMIVILSCAGIYVLGRLTLPITLPRPDFDKPRNDSGKEALANLLRTFAILLFAYCAFRTLGAMVRISAQLIAESQTSLPLLGDLKGWKIDAELYRSQFLFLGGFGVVVAALYIYLRTNLRGTEIGNAFGSFVQQDGFSRIFFFILFYRFAEVMVSKISPLFFLDPVEKGGLGLTTSQIGLISGIFGVVGIVAGGILGGVIVSKLGLRRSFIPLALAMHVPNILYLWASYSHPTIAADANILQTLLSPIGIIAFVDQMGYGIGFSAYMVYLMWVAQRGNYVTSHYAVGTGLGALTIMIGGILSGIIQTNAGYSSFFIAVLIAGIPGMIALYVIPLDKNEARGMRTTEID